MTETQRPIQKKQETIDGTSAPPKKKWRTWSFEVPASCQFCPEDPAAFALRELDSDLLAQARKMKEPGEAAMQLALWTVDGKLVDHSEDEGAWYWARFSSKVRTLVGTAFSKIHSTTEDEDRDFLSSMKPA